MDDLDAIVPPAIYTHCVKVYEAMATEAEDMPLNEEDSERGLVWTGYTTKLFSDLGLAVPYYTQVTRLLKAMDCIRQLRRGGGGSPSQWLLLQEPTVKLYEGVKDLEGLVTSTAGKASKDDIMEQRMKDMQRRIDELEAAQNG